MRKTVSLDVEIPEDAIVIYSTPSYNAGKYTHYRQNAFMNESEERVREIAAGFGGNGSGVVYKQIIFTQWVDNGKGLTGVVDYKLVEKLKPVTKFNDDGKERRKRWKQLVACKHKNTRSHMVGAGCQKDYDLICVDCNDVVG